jgi:hypothetical protein
MKGMTGPQLVSALTTKYVLGNKKYVLSPSSPSHYPHASVLSPSAPSHYPHARLPFA